MSAWRLWNCRCSRHTRLARLASPSSVFSRCRSLVPAAVTGFPQASRGIAFQLWRSCGNMRSPSDSQKHLPFCGTGSVSGFSVSSLLEPEPLWGPRIGDSPPCSDGSRDRIMALWSSASSSLAIASASLIVEHWSPPLTRAPCRAVSPAGAGEFCAAGAGNLYTLFL